MNKPLKVLVVDPHRCVAEAVAAALRTDPGILVPGVFTDPARAERHVTRSPAKVIVSELWLGEDFLADVIGRPGFIESQVRWVGFTGSAPLAAVRRAMDCGVLGVVYKSDTLRMLCRAILLAAQGKRCLSRRIRDQIRLHPPVLPFQNNGKPTARELQVLYHVAADRRNREIARIMGISVKTVEAHKEHLKNKLNLPSGAALRAFAVHWCLETYGDPETGRFFPRHVD